VKVAVLESGDLDIDDSAFKRGVTKSAYSQNGIAESAHAKHVTKIIAANQHSGIIRGVATNVADVEFTGLGDTFSEAELLAIMKYNLESGKATIFNHSWGETAPMTEKKFESDQEKKAEFETYDDYLDSKKNGR